ncbi:ATP-dependent nuclease [Ligilactobacillus acidipiscis]|uniref:ATP-dependent nuclease n=1 Tax=Ligilactobacillus acidipiscis TaxID=89059 RepID=UPI003864A877
MKIEKISIQNYRGLSGLCVYFNAKSNYIVGKNNIGKTCMLNLLDSILNGKSFLDTDFLDICKPIKVFVTIKLSDEEIGAFSDNFSPEDEYITNLIFQQDSPDDRLEITSADSAEKILPRQIKYSNFVFYSANIKPIRENDLTFNGSSYKLVPELVKKYVSDHEKVNRDEEQYDRGLLEFINLNLSKVESFDLNNIQVGINDDYQELITRSLTLQNENGIDFSQLGFGLQFSALIPLKIIDKIIYWQRYSSLEKHLSICSDGTKSLNIILGLDEPEVHLHPNLQLQLMNYIRNILNGKDENFNSLLHELFDIDRIEGQIIAVTHSSKILSSDYHEIIRFTYNQKKITAASGNELTLGLKESKQLKRQFPYFADALFSDGVILVEGDTEQTAIPEFAATLGISLVNNNVNIVRTDGVESMDSLTKLFEALKIRTVRIEDNDGKRTSDEKKGKFVTLAKDFEEECFEMMSLFEINQYLDDYHSYIAMDDYQVNFWVEFLKKDYGEKLFSPGKCVSKINNIIKDLGDSKQVALKEIIREKLTTDYLKDKSILNGEIIAKNISKVPETYVKAINAITNE